jgi:hypothetical protein
MLILDKSRALDLMVALASRDAVPEEFTAALSDRGERSGGFRLATYGPMPRANEERPSWAWRTPVATPVGT